MKPMLGTTATREELAATLKRIHLLVSTKLDGVRALVVNGVVLSRSLKPIPNYHVQQMFGKPEYNGFDGELIVGPATAPDVFRTTTSGVMSVDGYPDVVYYVFDDLTNPNAPFHQRIAELRRRTEMHHYVRPLLQTRVNTLEEVDELFGGYLAAGYEGAVLRNPMAPYKYGRSTVREAGLLKMKPFVDAEATCYGMTELQHNDNPEFTNELGRTARSSAKAGKRGGGMMGTLQCRTPEGVEFEIGTGFTMEQRKDMWLFWKKSPINRIVKYKSLIIGVKDKPRTPVFIGFRDERDM
jgi:DNA ligase-1